MGFALALQLVLIFILFYSYFLSKITIKIRKKKALANFFL
jgi:hypothetical protein